MQYECRITVLDTKVFPELQENNLADPKSGKCPFFNVGDTFVLKRTAQGAIVPLVFGAAPFYARQTEQALSEIDSGLIEAAQSMGESVPKIIFRVYLKESVPSIIRGTTLTVISLIGLTAMAGAVGAGGIGDFAIRYGYNRNQFDVTLVSVVTLVILVGAVQLIGGFIVRKTSK